MVKGGGKEPDETETPADDEAEEIPALPEGFDATGTWTTTPPKGGEIVLVFTKQKKFTWRLVRPGKSAEFDGEYLFDRSRVLLEDLDEGALIGRIAPDGNDAFVFRAEGELDTDGLRFERAK